MIMSDNGEPILTGGSLDSDVILQFGFSGWARARIDAR